MLLDHGIRSVFGDLRQHLGSEKRQSTTHSDSIGMTFGNISSKKQSVLFLLQYAAGLVAGSGCGSRFQLVLLDVVVILLSIICDPNFVKKQTIDIGELFFRHPYQPCIKYRANL